MEETRTLSKSIDAYNVLRKDGFLIEHHVPGSDAETATFGVIHNVFRAMEIISISVSFTSSSSSGTLDVERLADGEAPGAGTSVLGTTFDLSATANTVTAKKGLELARNKRLKVGDRLSLVVGGTKTGLAGLSVTIYAKYSGRGDYY